MENCFYINPRVKVVKPGLIEISFNEEEIYENKIKLMNEVGEVGFIDFGYNSLEQLEFRLREQIRQNSVNNAAYDQLYTADGAADILTELKDLVPELSKIYSLPQPVWEGNSTGDHCLGVANTLELLVSKKEKVWLWQIAALLHDVGKPVAAYFEKSARHGRKKQAFYNHRLAQVILEEFGFNQADIAYILLLIDKSDLPYHFLTGDISAEEVQKSLAEMAEGLRESGYETSASDLFQDLIAFWIADGSDYSVIQCWLRGKPLSPSFCSQFVFTFTINSCEWKLSKVRPKVSWSSKLDNFIKKL